MTQKSAYYLVKSIRKAYQSKDPILLATPVKVDEVCFVGIEKHKHDEKKLNNGFGAVGMIAALGINERETDRIIAQYVKDTTKEKLQNLNQSNLEEISEVYTKEYMSYGVLDGNGYEHSTVKNSTGEWVRKHVHTNGIEPFWALFRRSCNGTHNLALAKHLEFYVNKFSTRSNIRGCRAAYPMETNARNMVGKSITYKQLFERGQRKCATIFLKALTMLLRMLRRLCFGMVQSPCEKPWAKKL